MKRRFREYGFSVGNLPTGKKNCITDVDEVLVGHCTLIEDNRINTGVTMIAPHAGNIFREKVPAVIAVGNGFGKLAGYTQVNELGNIETYIGLTNTLSVGTVVESISKYFCRKAGNEDIVSINSVVGETNDSFLNDITSFAIKEKHVFQAINNLTVDTTANLLLPVGNGFS